MSPAPPRPPAPSPRPGPERRWAVLLAVALTLAAGTPARSAEPPPCLSIGDAAGGWLVGGVALPASERFTVRPGRNVGTPELVDALERAAAAVHDALPGAPPLVAGDLSREGGGPMPPHKSHQSGRDADIGLYFQGTPPKHFARATMNRLDAPRTWAFLRALLEAPGDLEVDMVFLDHAVQMWLYDYARAEGAVDEATLRRYFSAPHGRKSRRGIVRHLRGHRDHFHIRVRAPRSRAAATAYAQEHGADALRPVPRHHVVARGQTLGRIAKRYRVSVRDLRRWNPKRRALRMRPGDQVVVGWRGPTLAPVAAE